MSPYTEYQYLWPPRPEQKIPPSALAFYENRGFWAQRKKNGTYTVVFARGNEVIFKTRHNDDHKLWTPEKDHFEFFSGSSGWSVYCAELLHSKVTGGPKHELYIHDILVRNGNYLVGTTFAERQGLLHDLFDGPLEADRGQVRVAKRITLAQSIDEGFAEVFNHLNPEDEGLVLKDPNAKLKPCFKSDSNGSWMVKCRVAHTNYSF
jgi:hypothetical protein